MWRIRLQRPQINPIIVREARTHMRGARPYVVLTVFLALLALAGVGIFQLMVQQARSGGVLLSAQVGQGLFKGLAFVELLLVVFLAPAMTSGAISGEREGLTYDMLMATPLRPEQVLWGKLVAALSYLFVLIFAAVPVFSVVFVFGGVEPMALLKALALLIMTTIFFGTLGLFCSALLQRTTRATVVAYALVLLLLSVPLLLATVWEQFSIPPGQAPPPLLVYLQPFSALTAITTITPSADQAMSFFGYGDPLSGLPFLTLLWPGVIHYGPAGPVVVPVYRATLIFYGLLTVLLSWATAHLMWPGRRWRPRRSDLGFVLLLLIIGLAAYVSRDWWHVVPPRMG
ncbi:MAG: ABC transporter permease [Chloroflexaceae bacterium]